MHGRNKFEGIGQRKWWEGVKDVETSTSVVEVPLYWQIPHRLGKRRPRRQGTLLGRALALTVANEPEGKGGFMIWSTRCDVETDNNGSVDV